LVAGTQSPAALQQPLQAARSHAHAPLVQACDGAQVAHAPPAVPQAAAVGGVTHWPFWSQQPLAQLPGPQPGLVPPEPDVPPAPAVAPEPPAPPVPPRGLAPPAPPPALAPLAPPPAPAPPVPPPALDPPVPPPALEPPVPADPVTLVPPD
jgi:hypothetical protein